MAGDSAIAEVGETLVEVLRAQMTLLEGEDEIVLASPASVGDDSDARLTLYLYRITENGTMKNEPGPSGRDTLSRSPLALDLHYLLTAHPGPGGDSEMGQTVQQHKVLGQAMRVFHDNGIIRGPDLVESLAGVGEELRIMVSPTEQPSFDALVSMWGTFPDRAYQPSLSYCVSPVLVDSERTADAHRVVEAQTRYRNEAERDDRP